MASNILRIVLIVVLIVLFGILGVLIGYELPTLGFITGPLSCIDGSGKSYSETRDVDTFHSVELNGWGNLHVTQNGESHIRIEGEDNIVPLIKTYVKNDILIIEQEEFKCIRPKEPLNVYVSMDEVKELLLIGSGNVIGQSRIESDSLWITLSGSGNINLDVDVEELGTTIIGSGNVQLKGDAAVHEFTISGSGDIKSYELSTEKSKIEVSGSGNSEVSVSDELNVKISGSGDVYYKGDPSIEQVISGSGKLKKVE